MGEARERSLYKNDSARRINASNDSNNIDLGSGNKGDEHHPPILAGL
jgi:hypothetical protein